MGINEEDIKKQVDLLIDKFILDLDKLGYDLEGDLYIDKIVLEIKKKDD